MKNKVRSATEFLKPLPDPDAISSEYWRAATEGRLLIQECPTCGHRQWYPRALCTECSSDTQWLECSGLGTVNTFTIIRQYGMQPFKQELPYIVAMIELVEGPLVMGNITDCDVETVRIGDPVLVWFLKIEEGIGIPYWSPDA
ncbi:MAG: Zn-ribbon domain-containing OB-fold protein [Acidimicrobiia bacterium]|nr:Zn-ribbon domain-containing OB-fold protein [Acidimicrobiia bacterium]